MIFRLLCAATASALLLNGCIAIDLAGETAEAGVELTGAVIGTTAKTTGAVIGGTADAIIPGDQSGRNKDREKDRKGD